MYPSGYRNLRVRYPARLGWGIFQKDYWVTYVPDFVVERENRHGIIERAIAEVKCVDKVYQSHISQLNSYVRNLSGNNVKIKEKMLIVPAGVDVSLVPEDIYIMYLRGF
jgi:hypothetical protein